MVIFFQSTVSWIFPGRTSGHLQFTTGTSSRYMMTGTYSRSPVTQLEFHQSVTRSKGSLRHPVPSRSIHIRDGEKRTQITTLQSRICQRPIRGSKCRPCRRGRPHIPSYWEHRDLVEGSSEILEVRFEDGS